MIFLNKITFDFNTIQNLLFEYSFKSFIFIQLTFYFFYKVPIDVALKNGNDEIISLLKKKLSMYKD